MTIQLPPDLGVQLCSLRSIDTISPQLTESLFEVGAAAIIGNPIEIEQLENAIAALELYWEDTEINPGFYTQETIQELSQLTEELELILMVYDLNERSNRAATFLTSLPATTVQKAQNILTSLNRDISNESLLLTLLANLSQLLTPEQWAEANTLYGLYRD